MKTRSRPPQLRGLIWLFANRDPATDANGEPFIVRHCHVSGLSPNEMNACAVGSREGLGRILHGSGTRYPKLPQLDQTIPNSQCWHVPAGHSIPAVVFARAAAIGEHDPLTDIDSRLFVGLPAE